MWIFLLWNHKSSERKDNTKCIENLSCWRNSTMNMNAKPYQNHDNASQHNYRKTPYQVYQKTPRQHSTRYSSATHTLKPTHRQRQTQKERDTHTHTHTHTDTHTHIASQHTASQHHSIECPLEYNKKAVVKDLRLKVTKSDINVNHQDDKWQGADISCDILGDFHPWTHTRGEVEDRMRDCMEFLNVFWEYAPIMHLSSSGCESH